MSTFTLEQLKSSPNTFSLEDLQGQDNKSFTLDDIKQLSKKEPDIFGVPLSEAIEGGEKVKDSAFGRIIDTVIQDQIKLYGDVGVPEAAKVPESKEEKEFFGFSTEKFPTTEVLGLDIIDYKKVYQDSESVGDFASKIGKHITKTLAGDVYAVGDVTLKTTFAPIQLAISTIGQSAEETVLATLGEKGFEDLEKNIFGSKTLKAKDIKEAFEEFTHIILADTISKAPKPKQIDYFNDTFRKLDDQNLKNKVVQEDINVKIEPFLEGTKDKVADIVAETVSSRTGENPFAVKASFLENVNKAISNKEKPAYIDGVVQMSRKPTLADLKNTFGYQARWNPAKNYQGRILGEVKAQKGSPKTVITRQKILNKFIKDLNAPIATGRIKSKNTLGLYFPKYEEIRIKQKYDLNTAAHEIGHFINARFPEITKQYKQNPTFNAELRSISYDKNIVQEGFAEFMRLYLNKPETAKQYAPNFYEFFDTNLKANNFKTNVNNKNVSLKEPVLNAQKDFSSYWKQSDLARIESKVGLTEGINDNLGSYGQRFRSEFIDNLEGLARMERDLGKPDAPIYKLASGLRTGESIVNGAIKEGIPVSTFDMRTGELAIRFDKSMSLEKALKPVGDKLDLFLQYAIGRSSRELYAQGRERLFTKREIDTALALAKDNPKFEKAFADLQIWQKGIADFAQKYGELFTKEQRARWQRVDYLPYWRVRSGKQGRTSTLSSDVVGEFSGIKALKGGTENLRPILDNIVNNARMLIQESVSNRIKLDILKFLKENSTKGSSRYIVLRPMQSKEIVKARATTQSVKQSFQESFNTILRESKDKEVKKYTENFYDLLRDTFKDMGDFAEVAILQKKDIQGMAMPVMIKGKVKYFEVLDRMVLNALKGLDPKSTNPILQGVAGVFKIPKKIGQLAITLMPDFFVANFVRDSAMASIMTKAGNTPIFTALSGMKSRIQKDPKYLEWLANGGDLGSYYRNEAVFRNRIQNFYKKEGININKIANTPKQMFRMLEELGSIIETANRLGEYKRSRDRGASIAESVYRSKEISVDFGKRGAYQTDIGKTLNYLNELVMFLRPAILGIDRVYRGFARDTNRRTVAIKVGMLAMGSMALALLNNTNPMYQTLEDWDKDTHWHIFIPTKRYIEYFLENGEFPPNENILQSMGYDPELGTVNPFYTHWRIPKIWEIGAIASIAERVGINTVNGTIFTLDTGKDFVMLFLNNFRLNPIPQFAVPIVEQIANKSFFTGREIVSPFERNLAPELQGGDTTSRTAQEIGKKLKISPPRIEHLIRGYFHTFAGYGFTLSDQFFFNDIEDLSIGKIPVLRRFRKDVPNRNNQYVQEAYDIINEMQTVVASARESVKRFDPEGAESYLVETEIGDVKFGNKTKELLTEYNRYISIVKNTKTLSQVQAFAEIIAGLGGRDKNKYINNLKEEGIYNDIGALKKFLNDDLYIQRNRIAEKFVKIIESQREE